LDQITSFRVRIAGFWVLHRTDPALTIKIEASYEPDGEVRRGGRRAQEKRQYGI